MAEKKDGLHEDPSGDRKLSIPNSVQRRKFGSTGAFSRVVVCAVDQSEHARTAFFCMCTIAVSQIIHRDRKKVSLHFWQQICQILNDFHSGDINCGVDSLSGSVCERCLPKKDTVLSQQ